MKNFRLIASNGSIVVKADSKRYGKDAIVYQDISFMRCFDYIRRVTGENHFKIRHFSFVEPYTDFEGRTMGNMMWIEFDNDKEVSA